MFLKHFILIILYRCFFIIFDIAPVFRALLVGTAGKMYRNQVSCHAAESVSSFVFPFVYTPLSVAESLFQMLIGILTRFEPVKYCCTEN